MRSIRGLPNRRGHAPRNRPLCADIWSGRTCANQIPGIGAEKQVMRHAYKITALLAFMFMTYAITDGVIRHRRTILDQPWIYVEFAFLGLTIALKPDQSRSK